MRCADGPWQPHNDLISSQFLVCPIAKGCVAALLAAAQPHLAFFFDSEFFRGEPRSLVRTIAEWLPGTLAAGAEPVVTGFQFDDAGFLLGDDGVGHGATCS